MFTNITIKNRLIFFSFLAIAGFLAMVFLSYTSVNSVQKLGKAESMVTKLEADMLMLRRNEKDFLARKALKYKAKFQKNITILKKDVSLLEDLLTDSSLNNEGLSQFISIIDKYNKIFFQLIDTQKIIGLNPKDGLYGSLRSSVHKVQDLAKNSNDFALLSKVYELRKHEKDFMLRKDLKYLMKFEKSMNALINSQNGNIKSNLSKYKNDFIALVNAQQKIGLNSSSGLQGEMRNTVHTTEDILKNLLSSTKKTINEKVTELYTLSFILTIILILILILVTYAISHSILRSLNSLDNAIDKIAHENDASHRVTIVTNDEISTYPKIKPIN